MAGNTLTLEFAGDATKLQKAAKQSTQALDDVTKASKDAGDGFNSSAKETTDFNMKLGHLGSSVSGATDAFGAASDALGALVDIQNQSSERAQRQARNLQDVAQAQQDANQAVRDSKQAAIDAGQAEIDEKQAKLDASVAQKDYNKAVKEHGKNSDEARQALIDVQQAQQDVKQAQEDGKQATEDGRQATIDAKNAQLDLNEAQKEANPSDLSKTLDQVQTYAPLLSGLAGVMGIVTAAQWAWNLAQLASPTTWIILAILGLIAIIVLIATKTTWFQDLWKAVWGGIKKAASAVGSWFKDTLWGKWIKGAWDAIKDKAMSVWDWMKGLPGKLKGAFSAIKDFLFAPFRAAFNAVSSAWNNTIGRLSWTVPGWVPFVGGNTISAPQLPKFHSGGVVPGAPGSEMLAVLQAGETVTPAGVGTGTVHVTVLLNRDVLIEGMAKGVRRRGGSAQFVVGGRNA